MPNVKLSKVTDTIFDKIFSLSKVGIFAEGFARSTAQPRDFRTPSTSFHFYFASISASPFLSPSYVSPSQPALRNPPVWRLREDSLLYSRPVTSLPSLTLSRDGERGKKGPGRNGGALCPEFVPRRSPCSFTRSDKLGVALALLTFLSPAAALSLPTRRFRSRLHAKLSRPHLE